MDFQVAEEPCEQIDVEVVHISANTMYDTDDVYTTLFAEFADAEIVIPPRDNLMSQISKH